MLRDRVNFLLYFVGFIMEEQFTLSTVFNFFSLFPASLRCHLIFTCRQRALAKLNSFYTCIIPITLRKTFCRTVSSPASSIPAFTRASGTMSSWSLIFFVSPMTWRNCFWVKKVAWGVRAQRKKIKKWFY